MVNLCEDLVDAERGDYTHGLVLADADHRRRVQKVPQRFVVDFHVRDAQEELAFGMLRSLRKRNAAKRHGRRETGPPVECTGRFRKQRGE